MLPSEHVSILSVIRACGSHRKRAARVKCCFSESAPAVRSSAEQPANAETPKSASSLEYLISTPRNTPLHVPPQSSCRPWSTGRSCRAARTAPRCPPPSTRQACFHDIRIALVDLKTCSNGADGKTCSSKSSLVAKLPVTQLRWFRPPACCCGTSGTGCGTWTGTCRPPPRPRCVVRLWSLT